MMAWLMTYDPREAEFIVKSELEWLKQRIAFNIVAQGANATGKTIESMKVTTTPQGGTLTGRAYFGTLETGRRPTNPNTNNRVNLYSIIYDWMMAKGVHAQDKTDVSLAWAITKSIHKKGTRLFQQGGRDTIYSKEIMKTIESVMKRLNGLISTNIHTINLNTKDGGLIK